MKKSLRKYFYALLSPRIPLWIFILFVLLSFFLMWTAVRTALMREFDVRSTHFIGEHVRAHDISFVVNSVRRDEAGIPPLTPRAGNEFAIVDFTLTNETDNPVELVPQLHFYLKSDDGQVYQVTPVPGTNQWSGVLLAHDKIKEEVGFEVPQHIGHLRLYVETGTPVREVIVIDLSSKPSKFWGLF